MRFWVALFVPLLSAGCTPADDGATASVAPSVSEVQETYQHLILMTKAPVAVDPVVASLCISPSSPSVQSKERYGPHVMMTVKIYMNGIAAEAFSRSATQFPTGSIVVKEKQVARGQGHSDGIGGMIKRPEGYDPANGNWEYFYTEHPGDLESGKLTSCAECHRSAGHDHVFGEWAQNTSR